MIKVNYLTTYKGSSYLYVCSHFFNPLTPLFKARFYLYLHTTVKDFQCKLTMGPEDGLTASTPKF